MGVLPDVPLTTEAEELIKRILPNIERRLEEVKRIPVSILLWGPGLNVNSSLATLRNDLRTKLREDGHAAFFSEELCNPNSKASIRLQQLAHAQEFDLIVSTPVTPGSIGEIHDFAADRRVNAKTLIFLNETHLEGYSAQSLQSIESILSCQIRYYPDEQHLDTIYEVVFDEVQRIREIKYILAGRY